MDSEAINRLLQEIQKQVAAGRPTEPVSVRELIGWFGAARRGSNINWNIRRVLEEIGLATVPKLGKHWSSDDLLQSEASICP
jgi:hypothetical protein